MFKSSLVASAILGLSWIALVVVPALIAHQVASTGVRVLVLILGTAILCYTSIITRVSGGTLLEIVHNYRMNRQTIKLESSVLTTVTELDASVTENHGQDVQSSTVPLRTPRPILRDLTDPQVIAAIDESALRDARASLQRYSRRQRRLKFADA